MKRAEPDAVASPSSSHPSSSYPSSGRYIHLDEHAHVDPFDFDSIPVAAGGFSSDDLVELFHGTELISNCSDLLDNPRVDEEDARKRIDEKVKDVMKQIQTAQNTPVSSADALEIISRHNRLHGECRHGSAAFFGKDPPAAHRIVAYTVSALMCPQSVRISRPSKRRRDEDATAAAAITQKIKRYIAMMYPSLNVLDIRVESLESRLNPPKKRMSFPKHGAMLQQTSAKRSSESIFDGVGKGECVGGSTWYRFGYFERIPIHSFSSKDRMEVVCGRYPRACFEDTGYLTDAGVKALSTTSTLPESNDVRIPAAVVHNVRIATKPKQTDDTGSLFQGHSMVVDVKEGGCSSTILVDKLDKFLMEYEHELHRGNHGARQTLRRSNEQEFTRVMNTCVAHAVTQKRRQLLKMGMDPETLLYGLVHSPPEQSTVLTGIPEENLS